MPSSRIALLAALASAATLTACDVVRPLANDGAGAQCTSCHGYPPPPGILSDAAGHPDNTDCHACHAQTVDANGAIIPASAGGLHENGVVDAAHGAGWAAPSVHGYEAQKNIAGCTTCHGSDYAGGDSGVSCNACHSTALAGDWKTNCTFCHGTRTANYTSASLVKAAPPEGVQGQTDATDVHVGAHAKHVVDGAISAAISCDVCHAAVTDALGHFSGARASVAFSGLANAAGATSSYTSASATCSTYCHGSFANGANATPVWSGTIAAGCTACHGAPPSQDRHTSISNHTSQPCSRCHNGYTTSSADLSKHLNGANDVVVIDHTSGQPVVVPKTTAGSAWNCAFCHNALGI